MHLGCQLGELKHQILNENPGRRHPDSDVELRAASQVLSVCFSPNSKRLAMSDLLSVKVFDTESGQLLIEFERPFRFGRCGLVFPPMQSACSRWYRPGHLHLEPANCSAHSRASQ